MRVLLVNNESAKRCGIQAFGYDMAMQLRAAGVEVELWDGCYEAIYEKPYLPYDRLAAGEFDLIHFNWHPIAINHYGADHFPKNLPLSVYVNDSPKWTWCPVWDRADVKFMPEPWEGTVLLPYPCLDYTSPSLWDHGTIGWTGVRDDGLTEVRLVAAHYGWTLNLKDPAVWLTREEEIDRLARSSFNMLWYQGNRGISGAVQTCISAQRPILLNGSPMFDHLRVDPEIREEFYWGYGQDYTRAAGEVMADVVKGQERLPVKAKARFGWKASVQKILAEWERLI